MNIPTDHIDTFTSQFLLVGFPDENTLTKIMTLRNF